MAAEGAERDMRVLLFGTGAYYTSCKLFFSQVDVAALLDNDEKKQGTRIDGIPVLSPDAALRETYDGIYLLSIYAAEMRRQLEEMGVPAEKIFDLDEIYDTVGDYLPAWQVMPFLPEGREALFAGAGIVLLSPELDLNGAVIALFQAARLLQEKGQDIVLAAVQDGPMRHHFVRAGIPVFVDPFLRVAPLDEIPWIRQCRMLLVCTNLFYGLFRRYHGDVPILWWLHDPERLYQGKFCEKINECYSDHIRVYAVGTLALEAFQRRCPHWPMKGILRFGIADFYRKRRETHPSPKVTFAVVGTICHIKGQDIFLEAVRLLPAALRRTCAFWIIGVREETRFADDVAEMAAALPEVQCLGALDRPAMEEIYAKIDVLVCPSREDCMPVVTVEAMMNARPIIVSDRTGTAVFITEGENGCIVPAGDAVRLSEKMQWVAERPKVRQSMGEKARVIYEEKFSLSVFEKNLRAAIEEVLGQ